jgi:hypothetical protein
LNFPSHEVNNQGAVFNLNTQMLDFPRTARNLALSNLGRVWAWLTGWENREWCGRVTE